MNLDKQIENVVALNNNDFNKKLENYKNAIHSTDLLKNIGNTIVSKYDNNCIWCRCNTRNCKQCVGCDEVYVGMFYDSLDNQRTWFNKSLDREAVKKSELKMHHYNRCEIVKSEFEKVSGSNLVRLECEKDNLLTNLIAKKL